jgi:hypothetical protein
VASLQTRPSGKLEFPGRSNRLYLIMAKKLSKYISEKYLSKNSKDVT